MTRVWEGRDGERGESLKVERRETKGRVGVGREREREGVKRERHGGERREGESKNGGKMVNSRLKEREYIDKKIDR